MPFFSNVVTLLAGASFALAASSSKSSSDRITPTIPSPSGRYIVEFIDSSPTDGFVKRDVRS